MTEAEVVGGHHRLNGLDLGQTPGDGEGWGAWSAAVHRVAKSQIQLGD